MRPLLVTVKETATLLGVSPRTVLRILENGALEGVKVRRCRRVTMASIIEFAEKGTSVETLRRVRAGIAEGRSSR